MPTRARKNEYAARLKGYLTEYKKVLIVQADFVGSKQMQDIRAALRGQAVILMGKNTLIRKSIKQLAEDTNNTDYLALLPYVVLNMGFIFTNGDLAAIRKVVADHKVGAPAKAGQTSESLIMAPAGPTGQPPDKTSFFQALNIPTKISRGQIEISQDYELVLPGQKVGASQCALLQMLDIKPFTYSLKVSDVYEGGAVFDAAVLDIDDGVLCSKFSAGLGNIAAISLGLSYPTMASVPHSIINGIKDLVSIALECETFTFDVADKIDDMLKNPGACGGGGGGGGGGDAVAEEPEPEPEPEEEEEVDMSGGDLFGGDDY